MDIAAAQSRTDSKGIRLAEGVRRSAIAERDRLNKAALFNTEIDPVWANVARLIGEPAAAEMREILKDPNVPA